MEWIGQLQQVLGLPVLHLVQQNWAIVLVILSVAAWLILCGGRDSDQAPSDLNDSGAEGND